MTDTPDDGGPAFPVGELGVNGHYGMSLRDWFAGQALVGIFAYRAQHDVGLVPREVAEDAYETADAMLEARKPK